MDAIGSFSFHEAGNANLGSKVEAWPKATNSTRIRGQNRIARFIDNNYYGQRKQEETKATKLSIYLD
jgi:hypothetical protein